MSTLEQSVLPWQTEKMDPYQWLDRHLMRQPATQKEFQPAWQAYKYMLRGKMYAFVGMNDKNLRPMITLKLEPGRSNCLRNAYADIVPGYYMSKLHWSTIYLDGAVPEQVILEAVTASHQTLLETLSPKAQREILEADALASRTER